jgi:hypothetical protein
MRKYAEHHDVQVLHKLKKFRNHGFEVYELTSHSQLLNLKINF